jgi:CrcB protein
MARQLFLFLIVGAGGCVGSIARYGISLLSQRLSFELPLGTFLANILGCFVIGIIAGLSARGEIMSPEVRLALATGFCGGFTTMSSMIYETAAMLRTGEYLLAGVYAGGTLLLSMIAFAAGAAAVHLILKTGGFGWN